MLRLAARQLAAPGCLGSSGAAAAAALSTSAAPAKQADDYSLVYTGVQDLAAHTDTPAKEIGMCAGVPLETFKRKARVFSPARTAGQQGLGNTSFGGRGRSWRIAFETQEKWINPLMGWTSTADPLENVARASLQFYTKEEALAFCRKHGWEATVVEPQPRRNTRQKRFAGYGDNFSVKRAGVPDLSTLPSNRGGKQ
ncbi:NDUFS4 [Scenedesmus sp. PABB004]|nr:NDUFS4 [Scenedesmus sp. PABB004]